jgi:hypothetical protein
MDVLTDAGVEVGLQDGYAKCYKGNIQNTQGKRICLYLSQHVSTGSNIFHTPLT